MDVCLASLNVYIYVQPLQQEQLELSCQAAHGTLVIGTQGLIPYLRASD